MSDSLEIQMGTESMLRDMVDMEERRRERAEAKLARITALVKNTDGEWLHGESFQGLAGEVQAVLLGDPS